MKNNYLIVLFTAALMVFSSCKKEEDEKKPMDQSEPMLVFKLKLDKNQKRLNNVGQESEVPPGNAAQSPDFNGFSVHYIELTPHAFVQVGNGDVLYHAPETTEGGDLAIDFSKSNIVKDGEIIFKTPLKNVQNGSYEFVRASVVYQNYDIEFYYNNNPLKATIASFVGYNTYISSYLVNQLADEVNENKLQGYWAWETHANALIGQPQLQTGQAPGTTVPNPISGTSPIPPGSCLVTGAFDETLFISGDEKSDVVVELSFSINDSFEWEDHNENGKYEPTDGENVVDMGLRGLIARIIN